MESRRSCLPIVERGCCCELRTCCKVQGWLAVIGSSIVVLRSIYSLVILAQMCSILAENSEDGKTCSDDLYRDVVTYTAIMNVLSVIIQLACVICAALFLQGIEKNEPGKMVHFVRLMWVQLVAGFLMVVVTAIMLSPLMLVTLIFFALPIYCLICANSLHILMSSGQTGGLYGIPNQKLGMETA